MVTLLGAVRSIVIVRTCEPVLPASSLATARIAFGPSSAGVVQLPLYGAVASVANRFHVPVEHAVLAFEHS